MTSGWAPSARVGAVVIMAGVLGVLTLAAQFHGFLAGDLFPSEPDIVALEASGRRWFFSTWGTVSPLTGLGVPLLALPTAGLATPATWLGGGVPWQMAMAVGWAVHAGTFAAGWAYALIRVGQPYPAAVGAPILMLATGPLWSFHAVATVDMASLAYTGWVVAAAARWCASQRTGDAMLIGAALALVFGAGDPFMAPLVGLIAAALCWSMRPPGLALLRGATVAIVTMTGLVAPLLVEAGAFMPLSERAAPLGLSPHEALSFSTPPARFLELASQAFALTPEARLTVNAGGMNLEDFWYPSLTFGVVVILLGALGIRQMRGQRVALLLVGAMLAAAVLTVGRWLPAVAWVWEHIPPLSLMRFPERLWRYVAVLAIPFVGGGLSAIAGRAGHRAPLATAGVVVAGLVELIAQAPAPLMEPPPVLPPEFAVLQEPARRHDVRVSVDLRTNLAAAPLRFDTRVFDLPMLNAPDPTGPPVLKYIPAEEWPTHLAQQWLGVSHVIMPVVDAPAAVVATLGLEAAVPLGDTGYELRRVSASGPRVGTLLTRVSPGRPFVDIDVSGPPVAAPDGAIATVVPRVDFAPFIRGLRDGAFLVDERHHLDASGALTSGATIPSLDPGCADHGRAVDLDVAVDLTTIRTTIKTRCPALLSVPWRFLSGWRATVNGTPTDIVAVNSLTMGVPIDSGDTVVELHWRTPGRSIAWVSVLAALCLIATLAFERVRRQ